MQFKSFHDLAVGHYFYFAEDFVHGKANLELPNVYKKESFHTVRQLGASTRFTFKMNVQVQDIGQEFPMCAPPFPRKDN